MADFRRLYPEYNDLTDDVLTQKMYEKANRPLKAPAEPWWFLGQAISVAVIVPLFVLLLGSALAWALSGFAYGRAPS